MVFLLEGKGCNFPVDIVPQSALPLISDTPKQYCELNVFKKFHDCWNDSVNSIKALECVWRAGWAAEVVGEACKEETNYRGIRTVGCLMNGALCLCWCSWRLLICNAFDSTPDSLSRMFTSRNQKYVVSLPCLAFSPWFPPPPIRHHSHLSSATKETEWEDHYCTHVILWVEPRNKWPHLPNWHNHISMESVATQSAYIYCQIQTGSWMLATDTYSQLTQQFVKYVHIT